MYIIANHTEFVNNIRHDMQVLLVCTHYCGDVSFYTLTLKTMHIYTVETLSLDTIKADSHLRSTWTEPLAWIV